MHEALSAGTLTLGGARGFFFLYELLTGSLDVSLFGGPPRTLARAASGLVGGGGDEAKAAAAGSSFALGRLLLRLLPAGDACQTGQLMSILRAAAANPDVARAMPKFDAPKSSFALFGSDDPASKLIAAAHEYLRQRSKVLLWPDGGKMAAGSPKEWATYAPPASAPLRPRAEYRSLVVPLSLIHISEPTRPY